MVPGEPVAPSNVQQQKQERTSNCKTPAKQTRSPATQRRPTNQSTPTRPRISWRRIHDGFGRPQQAYQDSLHGRVQLWHDHDAWIVQLNGRRMGVKRYLKYAKEWGADLAQAARVLYETDQAAQLMELTPEQLTDLRLRMNLNEDQPGQLSLATLSELTHYSHQEEPERGRRVKAQIERAFNQFSLKPV